LPTALSLAAAELILVRPMTRFPCASVLIALFLAASLVAARNIPGYTYDELFAGSDFVVVAEPVTKTRDTRERKTLTENITPGVASLGVVTEFKSLLVLKGPKRERFTLHHYRLAPADPAERGEVERVIVNGPTFKTYEPKLGDQPFLMFLIRERDGRFAPVAGQIDPPISVQEINRM
jgi:hypothetical protein